MQIRGINSEFNTVSVNGAPTAQSQSGGLTRAFEFETTSLIGVESIEVTKAPTPDMSAASTGGNINLVSKSAFDRAGGRAFIYAVGGVYRPEFKTPTSNRLRQPIKDVGPT